jgi:hypothetical protein
MDELLTCPICWLGYDEGDHSPMQLPCMHNICKKCLPFMVKKPKPPSNEREYIECPMCKAEHDLKLNQIPRSLVLSQLLEAVKTTTTSSSQSTAAVAPMTSTATHPAILFPYQSPLQNNLPYQYEPDSNLKEQTRSRFNNSDTQRVRPPIPPRPKPPPQTPPQTQTQTQRRTYPVQQQ